MERTGFMGVEGGIDRDLALATVAGDRELLCELIELFITDTPRMLATIDQAVASGEPNAVRDAGHALKGSALNFGAQEVVEQSQELESIGDAGIKQGVPVLEEPQLVRARELRALLHEEIAKVVVSLEALAAE